MYASRWLLAPVYLGMSIALLGLVVKFFQELFYVAPMIFEIKSSSLILQLLGLIDLTLVGSLLVIVMFSGYENFVARMDLCEAADKLEWLGKHDFGSLKMKVAASIVAISSIHLLKVFMDIENTANEKLPWFVVFHITLVISAFLMGYLDKLTRENH